MKQAPLGESVHPQWVHDIPEGDLDSAARLYIQAERDATDSGRTALQQQAARSTRIELGARFPGVAQHAATSTADELGIVGDRSLRASHVATRDRTGLNRRDRHPDHRRRGEPVDMEYECARLLLRAFIWLIAIVTFPVSIPIVAFIIYGKYLNQLADEDAARDFADDDEYQEIPF